ncbi:MAG: hypothetical protein CMF59_11265 [Leptospiraceae bacterium]|nr:hypothetical protein [Leptospiraceae bacterium]
MFLLVLVSVSYDRSSGRLIRSKGANDRQIGRAEYHILQEPEKDDHGPSLSLLFSFPGPAHRSHCLLF